MQKLIEDYSQRPYIHGVGVSVELCLLRSNIFLSPSDSFHDDVLSAQAEICYFQVWQLPSFYIFAGEQNILRLEIPVGDPLIMKLLDPSRDIQYTLQSILLREPVIPRIIQRMPESPKHLPQRLPRTILSQIINAILPIHNLKYLQNIRTGALPKLLIDLSLLLNIHQILLGLDDFPDGDVLVEVLIEDSIDLCWDGGTWAKFPSPIISAEEMS